MNELAKMAEEVANRYSRKNDVEFEEGSYFYLIQMKGLKLFKLGTSRNPAKRLKSLQTGNPCELVLVFFVEVLSGFEVERQLIYKFEEKRIRGEWFELNDDDVNYISNYNYSKFK